MSLRIDISTMTAVLIAGTWYKVADQSFDLDSYEFMENGRCIHGGGNSGVCATGYSFLTAPILTMVKGTPIQGETYRMSGPLTALQAVRHRS